MRSRKGKWRADGGGVVREWGRVEEEVPGQDPESMAARRDDYRRRMRREGRCEKCGAPGLCRHREAVMARRGFPVGVERPRRTRGEGAKREPSDRVPRWIVEEAGEARRDQASFLELVTGKRSEKRDEE